MSSKKLNFFLTFIAHFLRLHSAQKIHTHGPLLIPQKHIHIFSNSIHLTKFVSTTYTDCNAMARHLHNTSSSSRKFFLWDHFISIYPHIQYIYPKYKRKYNEKKKKLQKLSNKGQQLDLRYMYDTRVYKIKQFLFALTLRRVDIYMYDDVCACAPHNK